VSDPISMFDLLISQAPTFVVVLAYFLRTENRITKLETTLEMAVNLLKDNS